MRLLSDTEDGIKSPQIILLFMFVGLFVGSVITYLLSRFAKGLPYTVVVFVVGILCAVIDNYGTAPTLGSSLNLWLNLPPDLIIYVFLPVLLFGESMTLNPHHVKGSLGSALLLAGPGALIGMYLMAALSYFAMPYGWSWNICCIFGAILCATDPVAVVALLHRVNASPQLTMLIVGEALLNDGSALVLFNMYYAALSGDASALEPGNVIIYFIKVCIVSPLLGIAFGLMAVGGMGIANRRLREDDKTIQMAISISCAYLSFFVAEYLVDVSGVICCCTSGFIISLLGTPLILDQNTMHSVWGALEWIGNTLLFLLAGLIIGNRALLYADPSDFGYIIVVYLYVMIVRMVIIVFFFPILSSYGQKISIREAIFLTWGGLRGGVSLALVLLLEHSARIGIINVTEEQGHKISLLVGGFAAITLILNALLASPLLKGLHLVKKSTDDQRILLRYIRKRIKKRVKRILKEMMEKNEYIIFEQVIAFLTILEGETSLVEVGGMNQASSGDDVQSLSFSPVKTPANQLRTSSVAFDSPPLTKMPIAASDNVKSDRMTSDIFAIPHFEAASLLRNPHSEVIEELLCRVRFTFLEVVRHLYWTHIRAGKIPRNSSAAAILLYSIDIGLDTVHTPGLQDWDSLIRAADISDSNRSWFSYSLHELMSNGERAETAVFVLLSFIEAHEEAQQKIPYYLGETEVADTPEEALVVQESMDNVAQAKAKLYQIPPHIISYYHSKQAARILLHVQEEMVEDLRAEGILQEKDASELLKVTQFDMTRLEKRNLTFLGFFRKLFTRQPRHRGASRLGTVVFDDPAGPVPDICQTTLGVLGTAEGGRAHESIEEEDADFPVDPIRQV